MVEKILHSQQEKYDKKLKRRLKKLQKKGHEQVRIGTGSKQKYEGMSSPYISSSFDTTILALEAFGYCEPHDESAEQTVENKALAALILLGIASNEEFSHQSLKFQPRDTKDIDPLPAEKDVFIDVMDATTEVFPVVEEKSNVDSLELSSGEKPLPSFPLLKLSRTHPDFMNYTSEESTNILNQDKERLKKIYSQRFSVVFEGSRGVLSTRGKIANSIAVRYTVHFLPIPDEVIDKAYADPNVWNVGPRVNLARLVSERKDLIEKVEGIDLHDKHKRIKILDKNDYHRVTDLIIYGKVDSETMVNLLKKSQKEKPSWQRLHRSRANV